jgi:DNA-binding FadR family transcriptional regulator
MLTTFDGGSGEVCLVRRIRTNTPLQALITLNDPAFVEAAGALGRIMARQGLSTGFARLLARKPTAQEEKRLRTLFTETLAEFRQQPSNALALLKDANIAVQPGDDPGLLAAWTVVGNVLLNLDEALTN